MRDDQLEKIFEKFDKLDGRLGSIDVTLAKQEVSLATHIKRTELAEKAIAALEAEFKPLEKHSAMLSGALKLLAAAASFAGIWKIFH